MEKQIKPSLVKPPLGLLPKWLHNEQVNTERLKAIASAIGRCMVAATPIYKEWIDEYIELKGISILKPPKQMEEKTVIVMGHADPDVLAEAIAKAKAENPDKEVLSCEDALSRGIISGYHVVDSHDSDGGESELLGIDDLQRNEIVKLKLKIRKLKKKRRKLKNKDKAKLK